MQESQEHDGESAKHLPSAQQAPNPTRHLSMRAAIEHTRNKANGTTDKQTQHVYRHSAQVDKVVLVRPEIILQPPHRCARDDTFRGSYQVLRGPRLQS